MSLVILADYKTAIGISGSGEDDKISQYSLEIDDKIRAFLGYYVEEADYTEEVYDGSGNHYLFPRNIPVTAITKLEVWDGEEWDTWTTDDYTRLIVDHNGMIIYMEGAVFPKGYQNVRLTYTAGYTSDNLPQDIQGVCKELMKLKYRTLDQDALTKTSLSLGIGSNATVSYDLTEDTILKKIEHYKLVTV